jgi:hypothetical protein
MPQNIAQSPITAARPFFGKRRRIASHGNIPQRDMSRLEKHFGVNRQFLGHGTLSTTDERECWTQ